MQAADDTAGRAGMVVLDEGFLQSDFVVFLQVESFQEKAAVVAEGFGVDEDDAGQFSLGNLKGHYFSGI